MPIRDKTRVVEILPRSFVEFMQLVDQKIDRNDPDTMIESDDLIQCAHAFGGLVDAAEGVYGFEFVQEQDEDLNEEYEGFSSDRLTVSWHYLLTREQIRAIGRIEQTTIPMWRCSKDCGRRATSEDWYCPECDFPP
ncbi:MAG: hypothetical protein KDB03_06290 [Planctomycetales bacterium]|nr:hypothetical protein [Planctomycetales bacterium]